MVYNGCSSLENLRLELGEAKLLEASFQRHRPESITEQEMRRTNQRSITDLQRKIRQEEAKLNRLSASV